MRYRLLKSRREPDWQQARAIPRSELPPELASWLFDTDSLTRRLRAVCGASFRVQVIEQRRRRPLPSERAALNIPDHAWALVRQVRLQCATQAVVYARTVMPDMTLKGARRRFAHLGNRPLGEMLFSDRRIVRGAMEIAHIVPGQELHAMASDHGHAAIWGRRSVFLIDGHPLLVNEIFLPGILRLRQQ